jgi:predicted dinucleotide-binding enzyme
MQSNNAKREDRRRFLEVAGTAAAMLAVGGLPLAARAASESKLKIGIIGSGRVGGTLGTLWAKSGHEVMFSSLDLEHDKKLAASVGPNARAGSSREAAEFGDVLLLAVPYRAVPQVGKDLASAIKGKVLIDASNPIVPRDGEIGTWAREKGAGDASAELLPGARIVRAFNAIGYAKLPEFASRPGTGMPIAGDDPKAIAVASRLIREVGLEPVLIGPLTMGKYLIPGTALGGERSPDDIRKIAATLK